MSMISLISPELSERMDVVESKKDDIAVARELLEKALIFQFQKLALGMCSYVSLYGNSLSNYCLFPLRSFFTQVDNLSLESIQQKIAMGTILKEWEAIPISKLSDVEIKLFRKRVKLWNDIEINEQLALLGSSFRFYFAGNEQLSIAHIKHLVGHKQGSLDLDGRFIFGSIGPVSATYFGPLFHFNREFAVSPFFCESEPGFTIGDTVVLRDVVLKGENKDHALTHELLHAFTYGFKDGLPFGVANWRRWIERDVCRFLITPHSFQEIDDTIGVYQKTTNLIIDFMTRNSDEMCIQFKNFGFCDLKCIINDLIKENKVFKEEDMYYSPIYRRGSKWDIF